MRSDISRKINRLPMWYYNRATTGDVLLRVTNDVDTTGQSLNQSIGNLVTAVVRFFGSLFMMLMTNGWMSFYVCHYGEKPEIFYTEANS